MSKDGFGACVHDVAHHGEFAASTQRISIHSRDQRLLEEGDEVGPGFYKVFTVCVAESEVLHFFDVGTCCKGFFRAGEDDGADGLFGLEVAEGLVDFEDEWGGEGIEGLGAVDLDLGAWVRYYFS